MKLKFWEKEEEFDTGLEPKPLGMPLEEKKPDPFDAPDPFAKDSFKSEPFKAAPMQITPMAKPAPTGSDTQKDLALILSRLDTLKAILDNVLIRLDKMEKEKPKW